MITCHTLNIMLCPECEYHGINYTELCWIQAFKDEIGKLPDFAYVMRYFQLYVSYANVANEIPIHIIKTFEIYFPEYKDRIDKLMVLL